MIREKFSPGKHHPTAYLQKKEERGGNLCAESSQTATADHCRFPLVQKLWQVTSRSQTLLCYSVFSLTKAGRQYVWKEPQTLWNTRELSIWCIDFFFFVLSWGCWDMNMPFWGKLIACSATKSKIPLLCELQFPEVHCKSKAVITMQHVLKEHHYTSQEEKDNLGIAVPWFKWKV